MMNHLLTGVQKKIYYKFNAQCSLTNMQKKGAMIEIKARINPISYEKPSIKRRVLDFSLF